MSSTALAESASASAAAYTAASSGNSSMTVAARKRYSVSFGNPALGTYHGFVYTAAAAGEDDNNAASGEDLTTADSTASGSAPPPPSLPDAAGSSGCGDDDDNSSCCNLVAMVRVPPDQVPEGVLNLVRPYRPRHVRIVIAENEGAKETAAAAENRIDERRGEEECAEQDTGKSSASAAAAAVLDASFSASSSSFDQHKHELDKDRSNERTHLVLIELSSEQAANELVRDLHGQPYTSLDDTVVCQVQRVLALEGIAGVSLMAPFFASPAASTTAAPNKATRTTAKDNSSNASFAPNNKNKEEHVFNCAVCLERMDLIEIENDDEKDHDSSDDREEARPVGASNSVPDYCTTAQRAVSILTTVCNHSFHMDCLLQWQDSPCPVCRYDHSGLNEALSQCHICGTTENNYVCLICGVVSCIGSGSGHGSGGAGSSSGGWAAARSCLPDLRHHQNHHHLLADMNVSHSRSEDSSSSSALESSSVAAQHTMHPSHARKHYDETLHAYALSTESQHVWDFAGQGYVHRLLQNKDDGKLVEVNDPRNTSSHERSSDPGLSEAQAGEVVHRKLEGFAGQYCTLLKSQLEQQRIYYEGRLQEIRREHADPRHGPVVSPADLKNALRQERSQLSRRLTSLKNKCRAVEENVGFIKNMNESLEANRGPLRQQLDEAQRAHMDQRKIFEERIPLLEDRVTRLMLQLENPGGEAADGAIID
jgi:BRCA1-associated protein